MAEVSNESRKRFCEELKIGVVREVEEGLISLREAAREFGTSTSQVRVWLERYGQTEALHRRLAAASIPKQPTMDNFTFLPTRGVQKSKLAELATGELIKQHMNLIITGPTGSGKSFLAGCYELPPKVVFDTLFQRVVL